jgi:hypothetical protein
MFFSGGRARYTVSGWDDRDDFSYRGGKRRNYARIAKFAIIGGFVVLAAVMAAFIVPRAGLNVEIYDRSEVVGTMQTVSVRVANNSFETMRGVSVQFGNGEPFELGDMAPFQSRLLTPDDDDLGFDRVTVTANDGAVTVVKNRGPASQGH